MTSLPDRVFLTVLDSVGVGELPDADAYGDRGSDTLGNISRRVPLQLPTLRSLGLPRVAKVHGMAPVDAPIGAFGRMAERSPGKDSVTGHWELAGVVLDRAFPTFPHGFPPEVIAEFERRIGRRTIGNFAASGTAIIDELGPEHMFTDLTPGKRRFADLTPSCGRGRARAMVCGANRFAYGRAGPATHPAVSRHSPICRGSPTLFWRPGPSSSASRGW